jgi:hypothetical protein
MKISQQIVGVNQRLGNTAVPNMQGTTRVIYDTTPALTATGATYTFFNGVASRLWPLSNINNNKFEVGESLAIQGFSFFYRPATDITAYSATNLMLSSGSSAATFVSTAILNFYIGNQRVIKDLDLNYSKFAIGESYPSTLENNVFRLETPLVIPPQIEFYATVTLSGGSFFETRRAILAAYGTGTLLNTKSTF